MNHCNNNKCPETSETCLHPDLFQVTSRMTSTCFLWTLNYHCCVIAGAVKRTEAEKVGSYERRMSEEQNNESQKQKVPSLVGTHTDDVTEVRSADPVLIVFRFWRRERS